MEILKNYLRKRKIAKLATKIHRISCCMSCVQSDREVPKMKNMIISYHIFNMSESNMKFFLKVTGGRYEIEYGELESLCCQMENTREAIIIGKKCRELSEKLFEEVPRFMHGVLLFLSSEVYMTLLEYGIFMILCAIGQFIFHIINQLN